MSGESGRRLAGQVAQAEMYRQGMKQAELYRKAGLAKSTVIRVFNGDEKIADETLRAVEGALGLPRGLLILIRDGDVEEIQRIEGDPDLIRDVLRMMRRSQQQGTGS